jgi:hypothetical protein
LQGEFRRDRLQYGNFARYSPQLFKVGAMSYPKNRQEARLQDLIISAKRMNIEVRTEKLLREAGYRAHSGRCRIKGQDVILIDRDVPIADQIEFLGNELAERQKQIVETSEAVQTATSE